MTARASADQLPLAPTLFAYEEPPRAEPIHVVPVRAHVRRVRGEAPPSGAERRDAALSAHEQHEAKAVALAYVREKLEALYRERERDPRWRLDPFVSADDIEIIIRQWAACPRAIHEMPGHWKGAVFKGRTWEAAGSVNSVRPRMHATPILKWRLRDEQARQSA